MAFKDRPGFVLNEHTPLHFSSPDFLRPDAIMRYTKSQGTIWEFSSSGI